MPPRNGPTAPRRHATTSATPQRPDHPSTAFLQQPCKIAGVRPLSTPSRSFVLAPAPPHLDPEQRASIIPRPRSRLKGLNRLVGLGKEPRPEARRARRRTTPAGSTRSVANRITLLRFPPPACRSRRSLCHRSLPERLSQTALAQTSSCCSLRQPGRFPHRS